MYSMYYVWIAKLNRIDQGKLDGGTYYIIFSNSNKRKYFSYLFVYLKRAVVI